MAHEPVWTLPGAGRPPGGEPDLVRVMVQAFAEALIGAAADAICRAPYGQHSAERVNYRSGHWQRSARPGP